MWGGCKWCALGECWDHQGGSSSFANQDGWQKGGWSKGGWNQGGWDQGGWNKEEKIEKKKTPWSFIQVFDDKDSLGLAALSGEVPDKWIAWKHGGKRRPEEMHSTLFLNMAGAGHVERLRRLAGEASAVELSIRELFLSRVERIKGAEVYCIGVGLSSPSLRSLKDRWLAEVPQDKRSHHVPYESEGHISLAYILAECREDAEKFVKERSDKLHMAALKMCVEHVNYRDESGKESRITLGTERPRKEARRHEPLELGVPGAKQIDGSVLEGGGQILRMTCAYAALFGTAVEIFKIRAGRQKPGLAAQHLESLRLVRDICGGRLAKDAVGSCEVGLAPSKLEPGFFTADPGTAGAITLMIQAALFPLLFSGGTGASCQLRGGTDVGFSPPLDFVGRVLLPTLWNMGVSCGVDVKARGFFPKGGGEVRIQVEPLKGTLLPVDLSVRGEPKSAEALVYATQPLDGGDEEASVYAVRVALADLAPDLNVQFITAPTSEWTFKCWVDVVVETTSGARFHGSSEPKDLPRDAQVGGSDLPDLYTAVTEQALKPLKAQLATGAAVDCHLLDQLILPASLAAGRTSLLAYEPSLHTRTAIHIAELLVPGFRYREEKQDELSLIQIEGIGHSAERSTGAADGQGAAAASEKLSEDFDFD